MTEYNLNAQDGPNKTITSNSVVYDNTSELLRSYNAPLIEEDVPNKEYCDVNLLGVSASLPAANGDFKTWVQDTTSWTTSSIDDAIFNANKIQGVEVDAAAISDKYSFIYDQGTSKIIFAPIVNSVDTASASGQTLIAQGATGDILIKKIQSSDSSVDVANNANDLDLKVPVIDLENTLDGTSYYLLSNPGTAIIGNGSYLFLGLNTQTPSTVSFAQDADNVYINVSAPAGGSTVIASSNSTGTVPVSSAETTLQSLAIPANTLTSTGMQVTFSMYGTCRSDAGGDLTVRFKFGSSTTITTIPSDLATPTGSFWQAEYTVRRTSTTGFAWKIKFYFCDSADAAGFVCVRSGVSTTWDWTVSNNIFMTAQTTSAGAMSYAAGTTLTLQT